jgi:hypothetical protein
MDRMTKDWTRIYATTDPGKAAIYKGCLEENGIPAVILNKQDSSYVFLGKVEIHVPAERENEAKALVEELDAADK